MKSVMYASALFVVVCFCSCSSKPSQEDISKKILMEYVCPENAKVTELKIVDTKDTKSFIGLPAIQYTVSGEVEWANGCDEAFGNLPAGYKEPFQNKIVTFAKTDDGWQ